MAKFIYKLQNVLEIKLKMEDQAKSAFGAAMARLNEEEARLEKLKERRSEYEREGQKMRENVLNVMELRDNNRALENLKEQIAAQEKQVARANREVELARQKLTEAMQERKIQEKLKENKFEEFKQELNAAESKEIDELVSYTYGERIKQNKAEGNA